MKGKFTGNYGENSSLCFKGVSFTKGKESEFSDEWYARYGDGRIELPAKKPAKRRTKKATVKNDSPATD